MGKINWNRVVLGGIVAGLVMLVVDLVALEAVAGADFNAALQALGKPAMEHGAGTVAFFAGLDVLAGIGLVWLYAAIRPRYGPGPKTAAIAAGAVWFFGVFLNSWFENQIGLFPPSLLVKLAIVSLVELGLGTQAGAWLYREPA